MFHFSPVHDLENNVEFDGLYQSVDHQAGLTFSKSDFPDGFFIVFVVRPGAKVFKFKMAADFNTKLSFLLLREFASSEFLWATSLPSE